MHYVLLVLSWLLLRRTYHTKTDCGSSFFGH